MQSQAEPKLPADFESQLKEARKRTERLINTRDRSSAELKDRLTRIGFTDEVVQHEVAAAVDAGLVDDQRFARLFIQGKTNRGWGQARIVSELRRFGIDLRLYEGYPECFFTPEDQFSRALECISKFHTSSKDPWSAHYRRLISRGYSREIAIKVLKTLTI